MTAAIGIALLVGACALNPGPSTLQVAHPCGVLKDSLSDVRGRTRAGDERITKHFEAGVAAGCWDRTGAPPLEQRTAEKAAS